MSNRTFLDRDGTVWRVGPVRPGDELDAHGGAGALLPAGMADGWLTFESGARKRRVYPIPPRWMEYSDHELAALCHGAPPLWTEHDPAEPAPPAD